ncbi:MAG: hypothetical protein P4L59_19660 [Desulfosporosinus sp.]|nr:hypothetical protein [Desulfosporosinus sp.]
MARSKKVEKPYEVVYLPSVYDPKKVREGCIEILNAVREIREKKASENEKKV